MTAYKCTRNGFTLIELSVVLVIIGLIVGGVLVGQDLIKAAAVRATIAQIEGYNTAVNTFRGKYGALPGDLNATVANQFGFSSRGTNPGQGDGNGILEGFYNPAAGGWQDLAGECGMFWVDLTYANGHNINLIPGSFAPANYFVGSPAQWQNSAAFPNVSAAAIGQYFPEAKLGRGNYIYVWSGGWDGLDNNESDGVNYFGIEKIWGATGGIGEADMGLTVKEAYTIDQKIDDGLPQSGRVTAMFDSTQGATWASGLAGDSNQNDQGGLFNVVINPIGGPVVSYMGNDAYEAGGDTGDSTTCYDFVKTNTLPMVYSMGGNISPNNSNQVNCALSFRFQ